MWLNHFRSKITFSWRASIKQQRWKLTHGEAMMIFSWNNLKAYDVFSWIILIFFKIKCEEKIFNNTHTRPRLIQHIYLGSGTNTLTVIHTCVRRDSHVKRVLKFGQKETVNRKLIKFNERNIQSVFTLATLLESNKF